MKGANIELFFNKIQTASYILDCNLRSNRKYSNIAFHKYEFIWLYIFSDNS